MFLKFSTFKGRKLTVAQLSDIVEALLNRSFVDVVLHSSVRFCVVSFY